MSRDGSDWDYINEHLGGHDKDGLPNFMSESEFFTSPKIEDEPCFFHTYQEAKEWALKIPGKVFKRSPNGRGFVPDVTAGVNTRHYLPQRRINSVK